MDNHLQLLTSRNFNGIQLDCYVQPESNDPQEFWMTREQIGKLLGYEKPRDAIRFIHRRNRERLDKFSKEVELPTSFNRVQNAPPFRNSPIATVYNFKGLLEICRYSQQEIAHKVIDVLWDIADEIRRTGMFITNSKVKQLENKVSELQKKVDDMYPLHILGAVVAPQKGTITFKDAADLLAQFGLDIGQNRLFKKCREKKLLCSRKGKQWNRPSKAAIDKGLFALEISGGFRFVPVVTTRGLQFLADMFVQENYPLLMLLQKAETE